MIAIAQCLATEVSQGDRSFSLNIQESEPRKSVEKNAQRKDRCMRQVDMRAQQFLSIVAPASGFIKLDPKSIYLKWFNLLKLFWVSEISF